MRAEPDLELVASIVRRAGLDCVVEGTGPQRRLRARRPGGRGPGVSAGWTGRTGWVGPDGARHRVPDPDPRGLAAVVVAQALHPDPARPLTHAEAGACGLAGALLWCGPGTSVGTDPIADPQEDPWHSPQGTPSPTSSS
ncbi:hypothetical protein GCM10009613_43090 [Pseudonocardia kongjuensis]|uniref:Uncharacterized protein n=1 Tax=Pseudonocardia kongjuensis TaxID=102227 RepID=A0ABP4INJ4_9PSEU